MKKLSALKIVAAAALTVAVPTALGTPAQEREIRDLKAYAKKQSAAIAKRNATITKLRKATCNAAAFVPTPFNPFTTVDRILPAETCRDVIEGLAFERDRGLSQLEQVRAAAASSIEGQITVLTAAQAFGLLPGIRQRILTGGVAYSADLFISGSSVNYSFWRW